MDSKLLENRLKERVNRKFKFEDPEDEGGFETKVFFIDQFHIRGEKVTVWCDNAPVDFISLDECNSWINLLKEIPGAIRQHRVPTKENNLPTQRPQSDDNQSLVYQPKIGQSVLSETKDIVMENIRRLQGEKGSEFIPQAQQINREVHTIINLAKTEIELIKTMRGE